MAQQRLSNIELLRIFAIFFVLIRHAGFYALGIPDNIENNASKTLVLSFSELFSGVGVNVFILISGYFGIKFSYKGISKFIYQCLFYSCGIYMLFLSLGIIDLSYLGLAECFYLRKINWFPKAYLCLYIFAPVLNSFVEHSSKKELRTVLISFFIFQTVFGCISEATTYISLGYSVVSFIGLYLLARYVRLYPHKIFQFHRSLDLLIYASISFILSIMSFVLIRHGMLVAFWRIDAYCNPLVIISSLYLLLYFSKLSFHSNIINWVAASSFAVYLLHSNPNIIERYYTGTIKMLDNCSDVLGGVYVLLFLAGVHMLSILIDQIRILSWNVVLYFMNYLRHTSFAVNSK